MIKKKYVLITPTRNEEAYIERTLEAVCKQTILPLKWIIVNDGSTDSTEAKVKKYTSNYSFLELVNLNRIGNANFGSKVNAFQEGYNYVKKLDYDFIGNLDADVSFEPAYFGNILHKFGENEKLGVAGGIIQELINNKYVTQDISTNSVAGAVQLFRKECYAGIGGYIPMEYGGIDAAAEILARMNGWEVQTFSEYKVLHHRRVKTGKKNITVSAAAQ